MNVFVSWSGDLSKAIAIALREWLPSVFQGAKVFMSDQDIDAGKRWLTEIGEQLQGSSYGILVVTADNQNAPWLLFEAGALSKTLDAAVVPILVDFDSRDLAPPLGQFQTSRATEADIRQVVKSMNARVGIPDQQMDRTFNKWWPDLAAAIKNALEDHKIAGTPTRRTEADVLDEILTETRKMGREVSVIRNLIGQPGGDAQISDFAPTHKAWLRGPTSRQEGIIALHKKESHIDIADKQLVSLWAHRLSCTEEEVRAAIAEVGNDARDVAAFINTPKGAT